VIVSIARRDEMLGASLVEPVIIRAVKKLTDSLG
jgi:hypothetical protein